MGIRPMLAVLLLFTLLLSGCTKEVNAGKEVQSNAKDTPLTAGDEQQEAHMEISELLTPTPVPLVLLGRSTPGVTSTPDATAPGTSKTPSATPNPSATPSYKLTTVKNEKGYVLGRNVNLRSGPGEKYKLLKKVSNPTTLIITGKTDLWYRVEIDSTEGFLLKEFVGLGSEPTPPPKQTSTPKPSASSTPKPSPTSAPASTSTPENEEIKQGGKGNYSAADIVLAAKLIYAEGKNQTRESFLAMANVLYNRCNSSKFGGTVEREVYRSGQFTVVKYDSFEGLTPSSAALKAAEDVFNGGMRALPDGVMFFRSASKGESWSSRKFYKKIGGNNYYY